MKWQLLIALVVIFAASVFADQGVKVGGIEYVDSLTELPSHGAPLESGYSFISHDANEPKKAPKAASEAEMESEEEEETPSALLEVNKGLQSSPEQAQLMKTMDPFVAKHYGKGFTVGQFGRPALMRQIKQENFKSARLVEDCLACRFIWMNVEMDIGNSETQKTIYDSFINQCKLGMKAPIMHAPCQQMFARVDYMITGYAAGLTVEEVCAQSRLCR
jgi:hypothetical protein